MLPLEDCHPNIALHSNMTRLRVCKLVSSNYRCALRRKLPVMYDTRVGSRTSESRGASTGVVHSGVSSLSHSHKRVAST
jgi:hypothetical protein